MATFNARAETIETKPVFRDASVPPDRRAADDVMIVGEPNDFAAEIHDRMTAENSRRG
jgi:putative SOS response-associated peptidase YedK